MSTPPLTARERLMWELLTAVGICSQLLDTRLAQVLGDDLPPPQFIMLNHFRRVPPDEKTVTDIARAFQAPQPGITKTIQKLTAKGFLADRPDPEDARRKLVRMTPAGEAAHQAALLRFRPDASRIFQDWSEDDLDSLRVPLMRLKSWLDNNRQNVALTVAGDDATGTPGKS